MMEKRKLKEHISYYSVFLCFTYEYDTKLNAREHKKK